MLYKTFNPNQVEFFPKCPVLLATGLQCPGCGSQRALHHILNFDFIEAAKENILLVLFLPYIILGFLYELIKSPSKGMLKWRNQLFGLNAIYIILFVIIGFTLVRNII